LRGQILSLAAGCAGVGGLFGKRSQNESRECYYDGHGKNAGDHILEIRTRPDFRFLAVKDFSMDITVSCCCIS
jgi:hypothetical protein